MPPPVGFGRPDRERRGAVAARPAPPGSSQIGVNRSSPVERENRRLRDLASEDEIVCGQGSIGYVQKRDAAAPVSAQVDDRIPVRI